MSQSIDYQPDGSYAISLYLDEIAHIVSGVRPYIILDKYDKNLETVKKVKIFHESRSMDAYPQLPDLEASIVSIHQISRFFKPVIIFTLIIEGIPEGFLDFVNERCDLFRKQNMIHRTVERAFLR